MWYATACSCYKGFHVSTQDTLLIVRYSMPTDPSARYIGPCTTHPACVYPFVPLQLRAARGTKGMV
jgi:hypothetical protein